MSSNKTNANKAAKKDGAAAVKTQPATASVKTRQKDGQVSKSQGKKAGKDSKPGFITRVKTYFKGVRSEVKRVVWPSKPEMIKYTGAVIGMLIFFGVLIALVDAAIVPVLYAFAGLRG